MKKVCIVTGSRSEYGLLRWVMEGIRDSSRFELQVVVTGMHLSKEFGFTYREIEKDGFEIDRKVDMNLVSDTPIDITKSMGTALTGFAVVLSELSPSLLIVLGDRYEILCAATSAMVAKIPIAHLHGGEVTQGAIDEAIRHSITKMAHLHFVASETYRKRVIQLGERPENVFCVGALGLDNIERLELFDRKELEESLGIKFERKRLLITLHPETLSDQSSQYQIGELLGALSTLDHTTLIFTLPNSDMDGVIIRRQIEKFVAQYSNACAYESLGQARYLSCLRQTDGIVGNSSSGIIEAPALLKGTVNIGNRQKGRLMSTSIINCDFDLESIKGAISKLYTDEFQAELKSKPNPYGKAGAAKKVVDIIEQHPIDDLLVKTFHDLSFSYD